MEGADGTGGPRSGFIDDATSRVLAGRFELERICALKHERKVSKDLVVSFRKQQFLLVTRLHQGKAVAYRMTRAGQRSAPADSKDLNARVDELLGPRPSAHKPAAKHPWRP